MRLRHQVIARQRIAKAVARMREERKWPRGLDHFAVLVSNDDESVSIICTCGAKTGIRLDTLDEE